MSMARLLGMYTQGAYLGNRKQQLTGFEFIPMKDFIMFYHVHIFWIKR
jgi:hypothetical protein